MTVSDTPEAGGIWRPTFRWITVGAVALIFLAALESLAITTVMPVISADLDGSGLYATAFAGTLATGVIGMVLSGAWSDRSGPVGPLTASVIVFVAGLIIAGLAPSMLVLVLGRLAQGFGTGGQVVALYVVVARVYPPPLHGRVFAAFAAAWVVPSLIGPFLAGAVAQYVHWRWVFLGVALLAASAYALVAARLRGPALHAPDTRAGRVRAQAPADGTARRFAYSVLVALGVLGISLAGEAGQWSWVIVLIAAPVILIAIRPLLPSGSLRSVRGLPSVVLMRALIAGALFGAEIYIPYLLQSEYGFSPTWAGLGLTAAALAWATASEVQGRIGDRLGNTRITILGVAQLLAATLLAAATAGFGLSPIVIIAGWTLAGGGMGLMYPRLTVLTLAYSTPQNQGFNSAALSIFDSVGSATTIAVMGLVFTALVGTDAGYTVVFLIAAALAVAALVPGLRLGHAHESPRR